MAKTLHSLKEFIIFAPKKLRAMAKYLLARYIWEVSTIYRARRITLKELNEKWRDSPYYDGKDIPRRTFDYHRKEVEMLFQVNIVCDKHDNTYRIEDDSAFLGGEVRRWLLNNFSMTNAIREARDLEECISIEPIPSAEHYLSVVLQALREHKVLNMTYLSFERDTPTSHELMPYAVKLFHLRWYVIGKITSREGILIFSMDRIQSLTITEQKYKYPKSFNVHDYYRNSFGIIIESGVECERVRLKVMNNQAKYFRSLPLHPSQKEVETTPDYAVFEYHLKPTYDFEQEILSHREDVEVLEPLSLRNNIKESIRKMADLYNREKIKK